MTRKSDEEANRQIYLAILVAMGNIIPSKAISSLLNEKSQILYEIRASKCKISFDNLQLFEKKMLAT